jgi:lysylphosphatidylglycerol synthetase-like protein (DUF2156 family)
MRRGWLASTAFVLVAAVLVVLAVLYGMGSIQFLTFSGTRHAHHLSHAVALTILAVLSLVAANLARPKPRQA